MEKNNDPSTGSGTNKNQNVKELTDEQLKEITGGFFSEECRQKANECKAIPDCDQQKICYENLKQTGCTLSILECVGLSTSINF